MADSALSVSVGPSAANAAIKAAISSKLRFTGRTRSCRGSLLPPFVPGTETIGTPDSTSRRRSRSTVLTLTCNLSAKTSVGSGIGESASISMMRC